MTAFAKFFSLRTLTGAASAALMAALASGTSANAAEGGIVNVPAPTIDEPATGGSETAIFAGGCFWGVQGVFQHVKGVGSAISGYAGGTLKDPTYEEHADHAESVQVTFDPKVVTYGKLLQIFYSVVHDPTTLNRQGYDIGPSYRSALFTMNDEQKKVAAAYIAQLDAAKAFPSKIVTEVTPYTNFYRAEDYHQDNATTLKTNARYVRELDLPKIANLKAAFPDVWQEKPVLVFAQNMPSAS